eukprot:6321512-Pyramimonas_sp.AAC.1
MGEAESANHRPVLCRACQEERNRLRVLRCSARPKEADGKEREFADRTHLTDKQVKHFFAKGSDHRSVVCSVVCRACHDQRKVAN